MEALVDQGFKDGALCLSSGLEYEIGGYATTEEVITLAKVAAHNGGFYISHIRDEADLALEAMTELVAIGERAPVAVQNAHIKVGPAGVGGQAPALASDRPGGTLQRVSALQPVTLVLGADQLAAQPKVSQSTSAPSTGATQQTTTAAPKAIDAGCIN